MKLGGQLQPAVNVQRSTERTNEEYKTKVEEENYRCRLLVNGVNDSRHGDHHKPEVRPEVDTIIRRIDHATPSPNTSRPHNDRRYQTLRTGR